MAQDFDNYFNYFTEVEEYFTRKRGRNILVSPLDWCLIELWQDNGIPLNVVLRGIDRTFESRQQAGRTAPRSLFYCHPVIMDAFQEHQSTMLGAGADEDHNLAAIQEDSGHLSADQIVTRLESFISDLLGVDSEPCRRAAQRLNALRAELRASGRLDYRKTDRELAQIGNALADDLMSELDRERLKEIRSQARKETKIYRKHLDKDAHQKILENYLRKTVLEEYGLPRFTLF